MTIDPNDFPRSIIDEGLKRLVAEQEKIIRAAIIEEGGNPEDLDRIPEDIRARVADRLERGTLNGALRIPASKEGP